MRRYLAASVLLLLAGCTSAPPTTLTSASPTAVPSSVAASGSGVRVSGRPGQSGTLTPSNVPAIMLNPAVTQATIGQTICKVGWTKTIRPRLPSKPGYENDHIVSLELGGSPANPANLRFVPLARARRDDVLENTLHRNVCAHPPLISLTDAQQQIIAAKQGE